MRTRFRKQQGWLKWDHGDRGEKVIRSTKSLKYNAETLSAIFLVYGLRKFNVKTLRKEAIAVNVNYTYSAEPLQKNSGVERKSESICILKVKELFQTVGYVPEKPDEVDDDGGDLKKLYFFALRRCQDATRRGQKPRESKHKIRKI